MNELIIGVDVDDVIADLLTPWMRRLTARTGVEITPAKLEDWNIEAHLPADKQWAVRSTLTEVNYCKDVQPIPYAANAIEQLRQLGRVIFITSCPQLYSAQPKYRWLQQHGFLPNDESGQADYFPVKDKAMVYCDILFDDGTHNLEAVEMNPRWRTVPVLIRRPHNRHVPDRRFHVLDDIHQAPDFVKGYFKIG